MRYPTAADALIPSYARCSFVDESRALVSALSAELKEVIAVQRNAALGRKVRVLHLLHRQENFAFCFAQAAKEFEKSASFAVAQPRLVAYLITALSQRLLFSCL